MIEKTVMVFIFNDNNILLSRRLNTWFGENQFACPGGLVEPEETVEAAAIREVEEETGLHCEQLVHVTTRRTTANNRNFENHYFFCQHWTGTLSNNEPERHSDLDWYPYDMLPDQTMSVVKNILSLIPYEQSR